MDAKKRDKAVTDIAITGKTTLEEMARHYHESGGFVAKKVGIAANILGKMFSAKDCYKILSFPACIISTGTRGLVKDLVKNRMFDLVITTCGTLDHDFARVFKPYLHGNFSADDKELHKKGINRLGNIFIPNESYGEAIENNLQPILKDIYNSGLKDISTYELVWEIGKRIKDENSIIYWCYKNKVPMVIPGITDGAFGLQLMMFMQDHKDFRVDVFKDEFFLMDKMFKDIKTGALMIGGGISKHHVIWYTQFSGGLDYAVYITTAPEWDGSLSGARMREAVSWGKVKEDARFIT
ncbi:MAG: deoxyhypusine synthase, partial [Candidatus Aenigmarchaeota archaeon]|nr:deoxyhypusine synthase [Candidatus Aenigmarchaeota archaeon]